MFNAPEKLPGMPDIARGFSKDELKGFSDVYEEIPFFSEEPPQDMLPFLNISDSENIEKFKTTTEKGPIFIRTDYYSNVLDTIDTINDYIALSSDTIYSIENLKKNFEVEHKNYKEVMEDIQRKLIYIDKVLFERGVQ